MSSENTTRRQRRPESFGSLYDLLGERFPDHRSSGGSLHIANLAKALGFAHETLYRAVRRNPEAGFPEGMLKVPVALELLRFSAENHPEIALTWHDLLEYVLPFFHDFPGPDLDGLDDLLS